MDRRGFISSLASGILAAPLAAGGQQAGKVYRIGYLSVPSRDSQDTTKAFERGMRDLGWIEGRNIVVDARFADGNMERLPELAAELVRLRPDVIVTATTPGGIAAKNATGTIPIVMFLALDPVESGLVASLARPGGNITGLTIATGREIYGKQLQLLKDAFPRVSRVAILMNRAGPTYARALREIETATRALGLQQRVIEIRDPGELDNAFAFRGPDLTLDDYLSRYPTTGLLIARGDTILVERYQYGRTDRHRFTSWSMAKTVTAMLIGIAIDEGRIRSVDDLAAAYVPELAGTEYGRTSLRHLLQMSSGVRFNEDYNRDFFSHDIIQFVLDTYMRVGPGGVGAVTSFNDRVRPAGTKFSYSSVETYVLGFVLTRAIGRPIAEYLQEKIWQPMGAEADATWLIDNSGQEVTACCLNAVLRDYARLGLLLAHDGNWRGRQIIPTAWVVEATTVHLDQPHVWPGTATPNVGYGYQTWILPGERRTFMLWGAQGQRIYADPRSKLVMVNTAAQEGFDPPALQEMSALWSALVRQFGG